MIDKIKKLEEQLDVGDNLVHLAEVFKEIAMALTESVYTERDMVDLKSYQSLINRLNTIRRRNTYLERKTRLYYYNLVQSYHLSLYFNSLREVLNKNKSPELESLDGIIQEIDFLLEEAKKVISKFHHKMLIKKANETKQAIRNRLSRINRLLNRFIKKKARELKGC